MNFTDVVVEIITGLEHRTFEWGTDDPAKGDEDFQEAVNAIAEILGRKQYNKWHLLAAKTHIERMQASVQVFDIDEYLDDNFVGAGATVGTALENYAARDDVGQLGALYRALDSAGGVDRFDWGNYADDGMTPTSGLLFIQVPAGTGEDSVYLFQNTR